ncbi:hypothetical protein [Luteimonas sp. YGD11-2]|uniref:hypothetical protein n=1 Tax=Luteimonas sp. YGD11-2 TaxID=2508168 RepID=UPI00100A43EF|nr:hypothetical protein [Luteimonas sp. YGD11-2]
MTHANGVDAAPHTLSFAALDARIRVMPDGPVTLLDTPRWMRPLNVIGTVAILVGLLPMFLVQWMEPAMWMVHLMRVALLVTVAYLPYVVRSIWVLGREFWHWRPKLAEQADHDLAQFALLRSWLCAYPRGELQAHRDFAVHARERLASKLGLLVGGAERVGVLPVLVAVFLLARGVDGPGLDALGEVPLWAAVLGPFLVVTWLIGVIAVRMRLQLELYEAVLEEALRHLDARTAATTVTATAACAEPAGPDSDVRLASAASMAG